MDEIQKHDIQFWLYNKVFVEKKSLDEALSFAAQEAKVSVVQAVAYLEADGRLNRGAAGQFLLPEFEHDRSDPLGIFVDIDWMVELLNKKGRLAGPELYRAIGIIYKIPPQQAQDEAAAYGL